MENIIDTLHDKYREKEEMFDEEYELIEENRQKLRHRISDKQRRLLLAIVDEYNQIVARTDTESFANGVRVGAKLMLEILQ